MSFYKPGVTIAPKELEAKLDDQPAEIADAPKIGENRAPSELDTKNRGNTSTPTRADGSAESDTIPLNRPTRRQGTRPSKACK